MTKGRLITMALFLWITIAILSYSWALYFIIGLPLALLCTCTEMCLEREFGEDDN